MRSVPLGQPAHELQAPGIRELSATDLQVHRDLGLAQSAIPKQEQIYRDFGTIAKSFNIVLVDGTYQRSLLLKH